MAYPAVREIIKEYSDRVAIIVADFEYEQTIQLAQVQKEQVTAVPHYVMINARGESKVAPWPLSKDEMRLFIEEGLQ